MKRLILFLVLGILCCTSQDHAWSKAYYMRSDGTATDKSKATACSSASTAMSVKSHNAQTFSPDDVIYLCSNGGKYKENIVAPSNGMPGHPIIYTNAHNEAPVLEGSVLISEHTLAGWIHLGSGLYKHERAYAQVFFEDEVALPKASTSACLDGDWYYDVVKKPWIIYYKPKHGTPADHKLERLWADNLNSNRCLNLADRSFITVHGLKMDKCGIGVFIGHNKPSKVPRVSNIIIHHNNIKRAYWGVWGYAYGDGIVSDVNIHDNIVSYSSCGIGAWTTRDKGKRSSGYNARFVISRNTILNLDSVSDSMSWNRAFGAMDEFYGIDHEGISFQDVQDSEISHNHIIAKVPVSGRMTPRAIFLYGSHDATVKISGNKILYNRLEGGFHEGIYVGAYSTADWHHAGFENNLIAYNVLVGDADPFTNHNSVLVSFKEKNPANGTNYFINNTIYNSDGCGAYGINVSMNSGNWVFRNNIIKAATNFVLGRSNDSVSYTFKIDRNIYATNGSFFINGFRKNFTQWKDAGYDTDGTRITDPLLNSDGTLTSSSPAIDTGLDLGAAYAGSLSPKSAWPGAVLIVNQYKNGHGWEIGAYAYP